MRISDTGVSRQPFHSSGKPVTFVQTESRNQAAGFLNDVLKSKQGIGILHGPISSGKRTVIEEFVNNLTDEIPVVEIDGSHIYNVTLLQNLMRQLGFTTPLGAPDELFSSLQEFLMQEAGLCQAPLLIVHNVDEMKPEEWGVIGQLSELSVNGRYALRLFLVGTASMSSISNVPELQAIRRRTLGTFHLRPLLVFESAEYIHQKLRASGVETPEIVMPQDTCNELHRLSCGWPGALDALAIRAIGLADGLPIRREHVRDPSRPPVAVDESNAEVGIPGNGPVFAKLIVSEPGRTSAEFEIREDKTLIGRSDFSDVRIDSQYVSNSHAMVYQTASATYLVDLNSRNGTFVNSRRVKCIKLDQDDIILLGEHNIRYVSRSNHVGYGSINGSDADTVRTDVITDGGRSAKGSDNCPYYSKVQAQGYGQS